MGEPEGAPLGIDTRRPSISRVYDFMLGGKDNFASDRAVAQMALKVAPDAPESAAANREFLGRVIRYLAGECGIRQFLDIGSGLPTRGNVHEIAQAVAPKARVVYVDNDPIVLVHGRALLATNDSTIVVNADLRKPASILDDPQVRRLIDVDRPVGLLLFAILHHIKDEEDPAGLTAALKDALPSGSYLAISHFHDPGDEHPEESAQARAAEQIFNEHLGTGRWRTRDEILAYFDGFDLVAPGLVPLADWRPSEDDWAQPGMTYHTVLGGVARKA